jgi:RNA polymerase sigma-70 factor (ECF subfamily)
LSDGSTADRALVRAFLDGRGEAAFRELHRRHAAAVHGLIRRFLGRRLESSAEDVLQETWIRACERLADYGGRSALRTWLCGIAVNCCRELQRARARADPEPHAPAADTAPELRLDLARHVAELADGYREVLVLHDVEGWTHEEIAAGLGIEVGTSKSQLARARRALRRRLDGSEEPRSWTTSRGTT